MYPPTAKDLLSLTQNAFTAQNLRDMEKYVLTHLQFELNVSPVTSFLENYQAAIGLQHYSVMVVASFLVDVFIRDTKSLHFPASMVAAIALYVALKLEIKPVDRTMFEIGTAALGNVMKKAKFDNIELMKCKLLMQLRFLRRAQVPLLAQALARLAIKWLRQLAQHVRWCLAVRLSVRRRRQERVRVP